MQWRTELVRKAVCLLAKMVQSTGTVVFDPKRFHLFLATLYEGVI